MKMCNINVDKKSRRAIVMEVASEYREATRARKGEILDSLVIATGSNRKYLTDLVNKVSAPGYQKAVMRKKSKSKKRARKRKYSQNALNCLERIWMASGKMNCKSLKAEIPTLILNALDFGWINEGLAKDEPLCILDSATINELSKMSSATIGRYLVSIRKKLRIKGVSTTKPGSLLRNSIEIRKAGDEVERRPGFIEIDTVAHCGNTLKGMFARSITATDVWTGWTENVAIASNSHIDILSGLEHIVILFPYNLLGFDSDNGSEFINGDVIAWVGDRDMYFTRSRPYMKNDNARVEQKNNVVVRRVAHYNRIETAEEIDVLNQLYASMRLRFNYFTPTRKVYYTLDEDGKRIKHYDKPKTPYARVLDCPEVAEEDKDILREEFKTLNLWRLTKEITRLMIQIDVMTKHKPESQDYGNNHKKQTTRRKAQVML